MGRRLAIEFAHQLDVKVLKVPFLLCCLFELGAADLAQLASVVHQTKVVVENRRRRLIATACLGSILATRASNRAIYLRGERVRNGLWRGWAVEDKRRLMILLLGGCLSRLRRKGVFVVQLTSAPIALLLFLSHAAQVHFNLLLEGICGRLCWDIG